MTKIRSWTSRLITVAALMGIVLFTVATPAHAAWYCNPGHVCLYDDTNGNGEYLQVPMLSGSGICWGVPTYFNDRASSARNITGVGPVILYDHHGCSGWAITLNNQTYLNSFGLLKNNEMSSIRFPG